jgi:hypothetical protein
VGDLKNPYIACDQDFVENLHILKPYEPYTLSCPYLQYKTSHYII